MGNDCDTSRTDPGAMGSVCPVCHGTDKDALLTKTTRFIEEVSIEANDDGDYWLRLPYVGYNLGKRRVVTEVTGIIERNTDRWRDARTALLAELEAALASAEIAKAERLEAIRSLEAALATKDALLKRCQEAFELAVQLTGGLACAALRDDHSGCETDPCETCR